LPFGREGSQRLPSTGSSIRLLGKGVISSKIGKEVLREMVETGRSASEIVEEKGLKQITDEGVIREVVLKVVGRFPEEVERFRKGEERLMGFFVGQVMKETRGKADPKLVNRILREVLVG